MKVWYMNLKDRRTNISKDKSKEKFEYCMLHNIVALGWALTDCDDEEKYVEAVKEAYDKISDSKGFSHFTYAFNGIKEMQAGDLVLVYNAGNGKYYILQIAEKDFHISVSDKLRNIDIGCYKKINKKICIGTSDDLKPYFDTSRITKMRTAQQITNSNIVNSICGIFNRAVNNNA